MYLIRASADELHALHLRGGLVETMEEAERRLGRKETNHNERNAWNFSLPAMARDLVGAGLGAVDMMAEYAFPGAAGEADVVLAGLHPQTRDFSYAVVELKQWRRVRRAPGSVGRFAVGDFTGKLKKHPAEQTAAFCRALLRSHELFMGRDDRLVGLVYLHNASDSDIGDLLSYERTHLSHLFTGDSRGALMRFLRERFGPEPGRPASERFEGGAVAQDDEYTSSPSGGHNGFRLLPDMEAAERYALDVLRATYAADSKAVLAITGASADQGRELATSMATALRSAGYTSVKLDEHEPLVPAACDVLFCDGATLLRGKDRQRFLDGRSATSALVADVIAASRVPVFLLADGMTSPPHVGHLVQQTADALQTPVRVIPLDKEFR
ncbi:hypothetical protein [Streptomyces sp. NPDC059788]|uniref:hypothetical protein n=1 Tax=Streptomyces sp. NPDC059788 TaxID=3346948 RepID=UPI0036491211